MLMIHLFRKETQTRNVSLTEVNIVSVYNLRWTFALKQIHIYLSSKIQITYEIMPLENI